MYETTVLAIATFALLEPHALFFLEAWWLNQLCLAMCIVAVRVGALAI
jgi:hypothetical protein